MHKSARLLVFICFSTMLGLLSLQVHWIVNYYQSSLKDFEKEVNLAFEDGIKKELALRCDTIQQLVTLKILDTSAFNITARFDEKDQQYHYTVSSKKDTLDRFSSTFSLANYSKALPADKSDTSVRRHVAETLALTMRKEDLESHIIYYRTQEIGQFMGDQAQKYQFDTTRLRPAFNIYLKQRGIDVPYRFIVKKVDSTNNARLSVKEINAAYPIVTKAYETYRYTDDQHFVRATFASPTAYILSKMGLMLGSSFFMILIVSACMVYILTRLFKEKRLSQIKNDFISNITHEFKTPIATVSVAIEALENDGVRNNDDKYRRYLKHAKHEIERLNLLVSKILNIAIYEDRQTPPIRERIPFEEKIHELISTHKFTTEKLLSIHYQNHSDIKYLNADPVHFSHALNNIIDNAIKYSGEALELKIAVIQQAGFLEFSFEDNGIGIPEKDQSTVFEKFYRVSTPGKHEVKGHGLGLNYVKHIMEKHNGWHRLESKLGIGTKITLGWPA